ncbi:inositol monophosphatase family protein [Streptomyces sp. V4-01]|uniref:inositol-phosphate phosphatase n=1 Tax=Actinacidiphila polyblastidii TaxID=3110430 RepID=A0ABU7PA73_9ACTN|nr:inositol monophosphatase family protein [Streptomyces sp. V4-01]
MGNEVDAGTSSAAEPARPGAASGTDGGTGGGDGSGRTGAQFVDDDLLAAVEQAVREVAAAEVLPRWRRLSDSDIAVKTGPYDLVTTADRLAEERLTQRLTALLPGSVVVGEEAVSADPGVLGRLQGDAPVWVIDPVDGTAAFVRGEDGFAMMVALVSDGEPVASWTYAPRRGLFATARRGGGAHLDGRPLHTATGPGPVRLWTSSPVYRTGTERARLAQLEAAGAVCTPCGCAGLAYLDVARGASDGVAFFWELPWDHAAGLLLVTEAGGASLTAGGEPFRVAGGNELPFTAARNAATAARVAAVLTGEPGAGPAPALLADAHGAGAGGGEER